MNEVCAKIYDLIFNSEGNDVLCGVILISMFNKIFKICFDLCL
jgi:hypothetical protein